jgi:type VI secretion system protein ImpM
MSEAAVNAIITVPGWFGKLPSLGDFASRRLPEVFVRPWDHWLQRGLDAARTQLGERWLDVYLVAPVLRFWVAPGALGEQAWAGLMMPSVDRVGRHFPLTVARPLQPLAAALASHDWFAALDGAARRVLDIEFTVDRFEAALDALDAEAQVADPDAQALAAHLTAHAGATDALSLWWCGDANEGCVFRHFDGLPPGDAFVSLIGGAP